MRPKKTILLMCPREVTASVLKYQMNLWGYRTEVIQTAEETLAAVKCSPFDLVIMMPSGIPGTHAAFMKAASEIECIQADRLSVVRVFDSMDHLGAWRLECAVSSIVPPRSSVEALRAAIKVLVTRKRGPRPQTKAAA